VGLGPGTTPSEDCHREERSDVAISDLFRFVLLEGYVSINAND